MASSKSKKTFYTQAQQKAKTQSRRSLKQDTLDLSLTVRDLRLQKNLSGADLCRQAGDLDPKTLTAVEKGRIKNPSIKTLMSIARGLGVSVASLFERTEIEVDQNYFLGTQKGAFQVDFLKKGVKLVSFTPLIRDFFCGKLILSARSKLDQAFFEHPQPIFVSPLVGLIEVTVEGRKESLKEGQTLFFNGIFKHTMSNPLHKESVVQIMTAPSFL